MTESFSIINPRMCTKTVRSTESFWDQPEAFSQSDFLPRKTWNCFNSRVSFSILWWNSQRDLQRETAVVHAKKIHLVNRSQELCSLIFAFFLFCKSHFMDFCVIMISESLVWAKLNHFVHLQQAPTVFMYCARGIRHMKRL